MTMCARNGVTLFDKFSRIHRRRQATQNLTVPLPRRCYWWNSFILTLKFFSTDRWRGGRRVMSDSRRNDEDPCSYLVAQLFDTRRVFAYHTHVLSCATGFSSFLRGSAFQKTSLVAKGRTVIARNLRHA